MLFAHGPVGFLSVAPLQKFWKKLKRGERIFLLVLGGVVAMSPDLDLFYYYFISAENSHRQYVTHAPLFWLGLGLVIYIVGKLLRKRIVGWSGVVIAIGGFSHIVTDSITGRLVWLWPFSDWLYGLSSIPFLPDWFVENLLYFNFLLEGIVYVAFFLVLISMTVSGPRLKRGLIGATAFAGVLGVGLLTYANQHVAHTNPNTYYDDFDKDGIVNVDDEDIDGDDLRNSFDKDADGDGVQNGDQLVEYANSLRGVWHAPFGKRGFEHTRRFGLMNNEALAPYVFDHVGRMLGPEIEAEYAQNPEGYVNNPEEHDFWRQNENLHAFMEHTDRLLGPKTTPRPGDVVFIQKGEELYVAIGVYEKPAGLLYLDPEIPSDIYSWESIQRVGEVVAVGRFH